MNPPTAENQILFFCIIGVLIVTVAMYQYNQPIMQDVNDEFHTMISPDKITLVYDVNTDHVRKFIVPNVIEYTPFKMTSDDPCYIKYVDENGTNQEIYIIHPRCVETDHGHLIIYV